MARQVLHHIFHWVEFDQVFRQVKTTSGNVFAQILPEIDQLQGAANGVAALQGQCVMQAVQMQ